MGNYYVKIELPFMCDENKEKAEADIRQRLAAHGDLPGWQWAHDAKIEFGKEE